MIGRVKLIYVTKKLFKFTATVRYQSLAIGPFPAGYYITRVWIYQDYTDPYEGYNCYADVLLSNTPDTPNDRWPDGSSIFRFARGSEEEKFWIYTYSNSFDINPMIYLDESDKYLKYAAYVPGSESWYAKALVELTHEKVVEKVLKESIDIFKPRHPTK